MNYSNKSTLVSIAVLVLASGCTTSGQHSYSAQLDTEAVNVCYARGTHTRCERVSAAALANDMEAYYMREEMAEIERFDD